MRPKVSGLFTTNFFRNKEILSIEKKKLTLDLRQNWEEYSDERKTELADSLILFRLKEAKLEQNYHEKFKQVLSINKVIKLYNAETQFKKLLIKTNQKSEYHQQF